MKPSPAVYVFVDRLMIVQIFAVVDGSVLDLLDGLVDLFDGAGLFVVNPLGRRHAVEVGACRAQVAECMQVSRMPSRFVRESKRSADGEEKYEYGAVAYGFHSLLKSLSAETVLHSDVQLPCSVSNLRERSLGRVGYFRTRMGLSLRRSWSGGSLVRRTVGQNEIAALHPVCGLRLRGFEA